MTEPHRGVDIEQAGLLGGYRRLLTDAEQLSGPPDLSRRPGPVGRGNEQQPLGFGRQLSHLPPEAVLDPPRQRQRRRQREPDRQLRRRQAALQLQQREWVAPGLGDDSIAHSRVQWPPDHRGQQRARIVLVQPFDG